MDQAKTGDSFSLLNNGTVVPGQLTWEDTQTLTFTPNSSLDPGTVYVAAITEATAKDGTTAQETIQLEFKTIEGLTVSQVFPAQDTQEVDLNTSITVIFNHPVVPVTIKEEQDKLPQPLKFTPAVKGTGEWVNSSVYVYQPEEILLSGTNYQVSVDAGIKDTLGNELDDLFDWQFSTRAPAIANFALKDGAENPTEEVKDVPLNQTFIVTFQQPMDQKSVEDATTIINRETQQPAPIKFTWDDTFTTLTIDPKENLKIASFYNLNIANSAQASDGGKLKEGLTVKLSTVAFPAVVSVFPAAYSEGSFNSAITITFASPMDFDSLKGRVNISPAIPGEPDWYYNTYDKSLTIYGLEPATDYVVRILPGMKDPYGNTIKDEISYTFKNGDYSPYMRLVLPWTPLVYRANGGSQEVFFEHQNIDEATVSIYPLTFEEFEKLTTGEIVTTNFNPQVKAVREWKVNTSTPRNVLQRELFKFEEQGKPLETGYYFIGVKGSPFEYEGNFLQGNLFLVATDNITFKATPTEGLAWVTDLESGAPQKDVPVTFYDDKFVEIGKTTTDKDGLAYLPNIKAANYARAAESDGHFAFTALVLGQ